MGSGQTLGSPPLPACFCTTKNRFGSYFIWCIFLLLFNLSSPNYYFSLKTSLKISTSLVHGAMNAVKESAEKSELKSF